MSDEENDKEFFRIISALTWSLARSRFAVATMVKAERLIHIRTGSDKNIFITISMKGKES